MTSLLNELCELNDAGGRVRAEHDIITGLDTERDAHGFGDNYNHR